MLYRLLMGGKENSEKIALCFEGKHYSYLQLHELAKRFSAYLQRRGIVQGDRIVIIASTSIDTVIAVLGCVFYGAVFIPIDAKVDEKELFRIVEETGAKEVIDHLKLDIMDGAEQNRVENIQKEKDQVYILYTSGSSGKPKGVVACVRQVLFCVEKINKRLQNCARDKILCAVPLSFDYGLYQIFLSLASGAVLYLEDGRIIQRIPMILHREHITVFPAVPTMLNLLCHAKLLDKVDLPDLRYICWTGDRLGLRQIEELHRTFPNIELIPMYGLTECKRVSIMPFNCYKKTKQGSCGIPLDDVCVFLRNVDENGEGELVVCGQNVMEGYEKDDGEEDVFSYDSEIQKKTLNTGDLFSIDSDGFLYFCGRKRRIIKSRGFRIGNAQIEEILERFESVFEIRVEGIPDELSGEKIGVAIFGDENRFKRQYMEMRDKIACFIRPQVFYFSQVPLPKNKHGKFDDKKIGKLLEERGSEWIGR